MFKIFTRVECTSVDLIYNYLHTIYKYLQNVYNVPNIHTPMVTQIVRGRISVVAEDLIPLWPRTDFRCGHREKRIEHRL